MKNPELIRLLNLEEWHPSDEQIALNLEENERTYLAKHVEKYDGIIIDLSHDSSRTVREAIASNKNAPTSVLKKLSVSDESVSVRTMSKLTLKERHE